MNSHPKTSSDDRDFVQRIKLVLQSRNYHHDNNKINKLSTKDKTKLVIQVVRISSMEAIYKLLFTSSWVGGWGREQR